VPRTIFFTFRFAEPRGYMRFFVGLVVARFFRAVRFAFFRSSFANVFVFAIFSLRWNKNSWELTAES
jgi:hypothetical protein